MQTYKVIQKYLDEECKDDILKSFILKEIRCREIRIEKLAEELEEIKNYYGEV